MFLLINELRTQKELDLKLSPNFISNSGSILVLSSEQRPM